jgi:Flp pilus assembly pilin Flp
MKPKLPEKGCAYCATRRLPVLQRVFSRVYAEWECPDCGGHWRTDAVTGKLIARLSSPDQIEGAPPVKKQSGQGMVEYALILAFVVISLVTLFHVFGAEIKRDFFALVVPGVSVNTKTGGIAPSYIGSPSPTPISPSCTSKGKGAHCK